MSYIGQTIAELPPVFVSFLSTPSYRGNARIAPSSGAWPLTNRIIYVPFVLTQGVTVYRLFWLNGATVGTNNLQAGVYDGAFSRIIAGTSTLSAGANVCQFDDITDTYLGPGSYYMALWCNGTTATTFRLSSLSSTQYGVYYETNAGGLPATGTPADTAAATGAVLPVAGLALRATDP